jgi:hypothetical protein
VLLGNILHVRFLGMCSVGDEKSSDISAYRGRYFFLGGAGSSLVSTIGSAFLRTFDFPANSAGAPVGVYELMRVDFRIK